MTDQTLWFLTRLLQLLRPDSLRREARGGRKQSWLYSAAPKHTQMHSACEFRQLDMYHQSE